MLSIDENQKTLYCANCGHKNHVYKKCKEPITSYGIICFRSNLTFRYNSDKYEILEQNGNGVGSVESIGQNFQITLGYEYLFKKERITPYLGF